LLGTGESKASIESGWDGHSVRISYNKYPTLPGVILGLLRSADETLDQASQSGAAEAVFPALDIIRRAGPPAENRHELRKHIEGYLGSRLWHVREIAARTLCSFLLQGNWAQEIGKLLTASGNSTNRLHGTLLTARFVVERKADLGVDLTAGKLRRCLPPIDLRTNHALLDSESVEAFLGHLTGRQDAFKRCAELQAEYLEILNLLAKLGCHDQVKRVAGVQVTVQKRSAPSALLDLHASLKVVYDTAATGDVERLRAGLLKLLNTDVNTTSRMLEAIPEAWKQVDHKNVSSGLCGLYLEACATCSAPEVRTEALTNLGSLMEQILSSGELSGLPTTAELDKLWEQLQKGDINPALSCAIVETSGTVMAALVSRNSDKVSNLEQRLRSWGDMLTDCLDVDNVRSHHSFPPFTRPYTDD
jgi:hypothetical protein